MYLVEHDVGLAREELPAVDGGQLAGVAEREDGALEVEQVAPHLLVDHAVLVDDEQGGLPQGAVVVKCEFWGLLVRDVIT